MTRRRERQGPRKAGDVIATLILLVLSIAFLLFLSISNTKLASRASEADRNILALEADVTRLEAQRELFRAQAEHGSDPDFLEKVGREKFNLAKPGEQVVVIVPSEGGGGLLTTEETPLPWWEDVLNWLGI